MTKQRAAVVLAAGAVVLGMAKSPAKAANTWTGAGGDTRIQNLGNWTPALPAFSSANSANNDVVFDGTVGTSIISNGNQAYFRNVTFAGTAGAFSFNDDGTNQSDFEMNYSTGATISVNNSPNTQTFYTTYFEFYKGKMSAAAGDFAFNEPVNLGNNKKAVSGINFDGAFNFHVNQGLIGNSDLTKNGTGTLYLAAAPIDTTDNTLHTTSGRWGGALNINAGNVEINDNNSLGDANDNTGYTFLTAATGSVVFTNNITVAEPFYLASRATFAPHLINKSGTNTLTGDIFFNGPNTLTDMAFQSDGTAAGDLMVISGLVQFNAGLAGSAVLALQGAGNGLITGGIIDAPDPNPTIGQTYSIVKTGGGTWTLNLNTTVDSSYSDFEYHGPTTVQQGTLAIGGSSNINNSSSIVVMSGAKFDVSAQSSYALSGTQSLKGAGTVVGSIIAGGGNTISPGDSGAGTLTIGSLTLNGGSTLQYDLAGTPAGTSDDISLTGNLTLSGSTTIAINDLAGSLTAGSYRLFDYAGSLSGNSSNFSVSVGGGSGGTTRQSFLVDTSTAHQVNLNVTGSSASLTWVGTSNAWDVNSTVNWTGAPGPTPDNHFYNGDVVSFSNSGSAASVINVQGAVAPNLVTFTNSAGHTYKFSGGDINDAGDLTASGSGDVTFSNSAVSVGGNLNANGAGNVTFSNNGNLTVGGNATAGGGGTLVIANSGNTTFAGGITTSGTSGLTIANSGNNPTTIGGNLTIGGSGAVAISNGAVSVAGNFNSTSTGDVNITNTDFTVSTGFSQNGTGKITFANSGSLNLPSATTLSSGTLDFNRSNISTVTSLTGNGTVRQDGSGTLVLAGNNTNFGGTVIVASGTVQLGATSTNALGTAVSGTTVLSGGTLDLNARTIPQIITVGGTGASGQQGAIIDSSGKSRSIYGGLILTSDTTLYDPSANSNPETVNNGSFQGNGFGLTIAGAAEWDFNNVGETHLGNITIKDNVGGDGQYFAGTTTLGDQPGVVTLQNDGALILATSVVTATKDIVVNTGGTGEGGIGTYLGDATFASHITMNGNLVATAYPFFSTAGMVGTNTITLTGQLTGPGGLIVHDNPSTDGGATLVSQRAGIIVLTSDANNFTGPITIGGGNGTVKGFGIVLPVNDYAVLAIGNGGTTGVLPGGDVTINTLGTLAFNKNATYSLANKITGGGNVVASAGAVTLTGNLSYTGATIVNGGLLRAASSIASSSGVTVNATGIFEAPNTQTLAALTINDGGRAQIANAAGSKNILTVGNATLGGTVTLAGSGVLDVNNDELILPYVAGSSTIATVAAELATGFDGGRWDGAGINSTAAHNDPTSLTALGYNDNGSQVIVDYTYYGDNDLSGTVTTTDFQMFLDGLATGGSTWSQGDYTYDGKVDLGNDFNLFLVGYLKQGGALSDLAPIILGDDQLTNAQKATMLAVVPEPSSFGVLGMAAVLAWRRRRRAK